MVSLAGGKEGRREGGQGYRGCIRVHTEATGTEDAGTGWTGAGGGEDELRPSGQRRRKTTDGNLRDGSTETEQVGERR